MISYEYNEVKNARALCVLIHGFNLNPKKFEDIIIFFNDQKISTMNVTLTGHDGSNKFHKEVSAARWKEDSWQAFKAALKISKNQKIPLYHLGYSTGALIANTLMLEKDFRVDKQFLFAPALKMRNYIPFAKFLGKKSIPHSLLPQINFKNYRASTYLPAKFYEAFFGLYDQWLTLKGKEKLDIPSFTFVRSGDELVSPKGLKKFIKTHAFNKWEYQEFERLKSFPLQHLIVDQESFGQKDWSTVLKKIQKHI